MLNLLSVNAMLLHIQRLVEIGAGGVSSDIDSIIVYDSPNVCSGVYPTYREGVYIVCVDELTYEMWTWLKGRFDVRAVIVQSLDTRNMHEDLAVIRNDLRKLNKDKSPLDFSVRVIHSNLEEEDSEEYKRTAPIELPAGERGTNARPISSESCLLALADLFTLPENTRIKNIMDTKIPMIEATLYFVALELDEESRTIEINNLRENAFASIAIFQNREQLAGLSARYEIGPDALGFKITSDMADIVDDMCLNIHSRCQTFIASTPHLFASIDKFEREINLEICEILGLGAQLNELTNRCYNAADLSFKAIGATNGSN